MTILGKAATTGCAFLGLSLLFFIFWGVLSSGGSFPETESRWEKAWDSLSSICFVAGVVILIICGLLRIWGIDHGSSE